MKKTPAAILLLIGAGTLALAVGPLPAQPEAPPPRSLDDQLPDDRSADPIDELDRELFGPGDEQIKPGDPPGEGPEDLRARLQRELGAAGVAEDDNPLLEVTRQMREVEGRIARNDSGLMTQGQQQQIVADLERLIEQARKSCQGGKPGSTPSKVAWGGQPKQGPPGKKPGTTPGVAPVQETGNGENRKPDRQQMQTLMQQLWKVALPLQQRKQLLQSPFDEFLPKYELLTEQYFRRLSEEKDDR